MRFALRRAPIVALCAAIVAALFIPLASGAGAAQGFTFTRYAGANRFDTARLIAVDTFGTAQTVLIATGVNNRRPPMDEELHEDALARGLIRYCPICDGYEVTDKKIGVIGSGSHGVAESVFLRGFTEDITLIAPDRSHDLSAEDRARMKEFGIKCEDGPC